MFDFAWSEIAIIAGVALVVIGPKDLPVALRTVSGLVKKARRMAAEFQTHVDEMMKEADLKDVRDSIDSIKNFDFKSTVEKAIDPDGTIGGAFAGNPLDPTVNEAVPDEPLPPPLPERVPAPAFMPPHLVPLVHGPDAMAPPPSFIPPVPVLQRPPS